MRIFSGIITLLIVLSLLLSSTYGFAQEDPDQALPKNIIIMGRVEHLSYEGGFYGIVADDGTQYKPINMPQSYQIENLRVKALARPVEKKLLTSGWGDLIEIVDIERAR